MIVRGDCEWTFQNGSFHVNSPQAGRSISHAHAADWRESYGSAERFARAVLWQYRIQLLIATDVILIALACWVGYTVRFEFSSLELLVPIIPAIPNTHVYLIASTMITICWIGLVWKDGGYRTRLYSMIPLSDQMATVLKSGVLAVGVSMAMLFLVRPILVSRVFIFLTMIIAIVLTMLSRVTLVMLDRWMGRRGVVLNRFIVIGGGESFSGLVDDLSKVSTTLSLVGLVGLRLEPTPPSPSFARIPVLGTVPDLGQIYENHPFDGVIFTTNGNDYECFPQAKESIIELVNLCEFHGIPFYMIPHSLDVAVNKHELGSVCGWPVIEIRDASQHILYRMVKRGMDLTMAAMVLILGMPLWLAIMAAIKFTSKGPVFYSQERVGLNGRPFQLHKFRTMVQDAEDRLPQLVNFDVLREPVFKIDNDPRVTPIGRILRRTGLDEIPQLLCVLKGEMSVVGPRPEQAALVERYNVWQRRRLKGVPGITGYQQVMCRGTTSLSDRIDYDLYYLKHQSISLDLLILLKTIAVVVRGAGIH